MQEQMYNDGRYDKGMLLAGISEDGRDIILQVHGGDWQIQEIGNALRHLTVLPKTDKNKHHGFAHVPLTWAVVTQLARLGELYGFTWKPEPDLNQWIYDEFTRRHDENGDLVFDWKKQFDDKQPMPHQLAGAYVGALNKRFFFADDMGTGKTLTALLTFAELEARGDNPFPVFVICPASVVDPWLEELAQWFPDWPATAYRGVNRKKLSTRYKVYVMSWDVFRRDMQPPELGQCERCKLTISWNRKLQKAYERWTIGGNGKEEERAAARKLILHHDCPDILPSKGYSAFRPFDSSKTHLPPLLEFVVPKTVVYDEAHALCNVKTKQSIAAKKFARIVDNAFPMSGTPITNDVGGFWTALNVLDIRSFPNQERYKLRYTDSHQPDYGAREVTGLTTANRQEFYTLMQGSMRSTRKADVLTDLPPKTYSTRIVDIPPAYRAAYDEMEEDMIAHIPDTEEPLPVMSTLAQLQRLTQLASSACDVAIEMVLDEKPDSPTFGEQVPHYKVTMREPSWKVDELMAVLDEMRGSPLVTFAPHAQLMTIAGARAEREGYRVGYIKGGQTSTSRTNIRRSFQNYELDLLCVTQQAGGVGLTLTAAHTAVYLERSWAYWINSQSEDRLHRRGQAKQVHIIDIVARNTIEARVREALRNKAQQLSDLIRDPRIVRELLGGQRLRI